MIIDIEKRYISLIKKILNSDNARLTRNDNGTLSIFGEMFTFEVNKHLPLLTARRIFYKGVFGELAAMLHIPTHVKDFKKFGCNYWEAWADKKGNLNLDYGREWYAHDQIKTLKENLYNNRSSRRMIINAWNPSHLQELSLPCCHTNYQFYVDKNGLSMNWHQRSVDVMIGMPSNMLFSATLLIIIANEFNLNPHRVNMMLGDCHIYSSHIPKTYDYINNFNRNLTENGKDYYKNHGEYKLEINQGHDFTTFIPADITITSFKEAPNIKFDLYS